MSSKLTRRRFVAAFAAGCAAWSAGCSRQESTAEAFVVEIVGRIHVPDPWRIGEAFLSTQSEPVRGEGLLAEIFKEVPADSPLRELVNSFESRVRDDFEQERWVSLEGWVVSLTEARFCALLKLDQ